MLKYLPFELHCHTVHSDGKMTPEVLARKAAEDGLAGFALTDHNTVSGWSDAVREGEKHGLTVIPGIEWTTFYGHLTVLGKNALVRDWREATPRTVAELTEKLRLAGNAVGVAHPFRIGYPICTGGSDEWGLQSYRNFTHYEVWSYLSPQKNDTNRKAEERYRALIASGERLAVVYGRDFHAPGIGAYGVTFLGVEHEGAEGALDAITAGRTYVSTGVELTAECCQNGKTHEFGGILHPGQVELRADMRLWREEYASRYGVEPGGFLLYGTATAEREWNGERIALDLKPGYLMLCADGKIEGQKGRLALCTPYYVLEE